jgi:hypothetical protein
MATWRSGYAPVCKAGHVGSNPAVASNSSGSACAPANNGRVGHARQFREMGVGQTFLDERSTRPKALQVLTTGSGNCRGLPFALSAPGVRFALDLRDQNTMVRKTQHRVRIECM